MVRAHQASYSAWIYPSSPLNRLDLEPGAKSLASGRGEKLEGHLFFLHDSLWDLFAVFSAFLFGHRIRHMTSSDAKKSH